MYRGVKTETGRLGLGRLLSFSCCCCYWDWPLLLAVAIYTMPLHLAHCALPVTHACPVLVLCVCQLCVFQCQCICTFLSLHLSPHTPHSILLHLFPCPLSHIKVRFKLPSQHTSGHAQSHIERFRAWLSLVV